VCFSNVEQITYEISVFHCTQTSVYGNAFGDNMQQQLMMMMMMMMMWSPHHYLQVTSSGLPV